MGLLNHFFTLLYCKKDNIWLLSFFVCGYVYCVNGAVLNIQGCKLKRGLKELYT